MGKDKKAAKLEDAADQLVAQAEMLRAKASKLSGKAASTAGDVRDRAEAKVREVRGEEEESGGRKGLLTLLAAGIGATAFFLKRKREQELDEALWEEPRSL